MSLHRTTFLTRADRELGKASVLALFGQATIAHRRHRLHGVLAFTGSHFLQVVEGATEDIASVLALVRADPRNCDLLVLCDEPVAGRRFGDWSTVCVGDPALAQAIERAHGGGSCCKTAAVLVDGVVRDAGLNANDPAARRCTTLGACGDMLDQLMISPSRHAQAHACC
jgi:hypothetical protein